MAHEGSRLGSQGDKASSLGEFIQESPVFCGRDGLSPQLLACLQGSVYVGRKQASKAGRILRPLTEVNLYRRVSEQLFAAAGFMSVLELELRDIRFAAMSRTRPDQIPSR